MQDYIERVTDSLRLSVMVARDAKAIVHLSKGFSLGFFCCQMNTEISSIEAFL